MLNGISGRPILSYNKTNTQPEKVTTQKIKNIASQLKVVKNKFENITNTREITGKFEVNHKRAGELLSLKNELIAISGQSNKHLNTIDNSAYNHASFKTRNLNKLAREASSLEEKIDKLLGGHDFENHQLQQQTRAMNDPKAIQRRREIEQQRKIDAKTDQHNGGMVK